MLLVFSKRVLFLILSLCLSLSSSPRLGHSTTDTYLRDTAGAFQRDPLGPRLSNLSKLRSALSSASIRGPWLFGRQLEQLVWVDNGSGFGSASSRCSVTLLISKNSSSTSSTSQASCSFCCAACSSGELSEHGTRSWSASSSKVSSEKKNWVTFASLSREQIQKFYWVPFKDSTHRHSTPLLYHLDAGNSMMG